MRFLLTGKEMKIWESRMMEKYKVPSLLLMERAAGTVVRELLQGDYDLRKVLIVCGVGNNGGDGLAAARMLLTKGICVYVDLIGDLERFSMEARQQYEMYRAIGGKFVTQPCFEEYTVIVDAVLGIGCNRDICGEMAKVIEKINQSPAEVIAVDIPSGVSADTGRICASAVKADVTITFFTRKLGMVLYPGNSYCGTVKVENLDLPFDQTEECHVITFDEDDLKMLPPRKADGHKGTFGKVLVIAGSPKIGGAAYLSAAAAYRTGAGLVKIYTPGENRYALQTLLPEALLELYDREKPNLKQLNECISWADVIVIGPGIGTDPVAEKIVNDTIHKSKVPLVIDADGINILAKNKNWLYDKKVPVLITPHILEMARLAECSKEEIVKDRIDAAKRFTEKYPVLLALKDARTIVAENDQLLYVNTSGNSGMATGGSGDVLAGMMGGLLAQGMDALEAARFAVYLHGLAGDAAAKQMSSYSMTATDILNGIAEVTRI